jgi:acyl phosphate:glycerol-3-phosphate acyltransferase
MNFLAAVILAYFLGAIPFGYLLVRWTTGRDVRSAGSGNIGATNVLRTTGRAAGVATLILDLGKGYMAVWLASRFSGGSMLVMSAATLAVMAGHAYPVFLKFKGGKAVASCVGAFLCLTPLALAATLVVFVVVVATTRYISLGSVLAAGSLPLAVWLVSHAPTPALIAALVAGGFVIWRHKGNIERLRAGQEHVFSFGGRHP